MPSWFGLVSKVYLLPEKEEKHFLEKEKYVDFKVMELLLTLL